MCERFGADVAMTSKSCKNGTKARVEETVRCLKEDCDAVTNFQGDLFLSHIVNMFTALGKFHE